MPDEGESTEREMNPNGSDSQAGTPKPQLKRRTNIWLVIVAALFIIVPFLTWYGTWFGRELSDEDLAKYLGRIMEAPSAPAAWPARARIEGSVTVLVIRGALLCIA